MHVNLLLRLQAPVLLHRLIMIQHPDLRLVVLKLYKSMLCGLGGKWRQDNMDIVSAVFHHVRLEMVDKYMVISPLMDGKKSMVNNIRLLMKMNRRLRSFNLMYNTMQAKSQSESLDREQ